MSKTERAYDVKVWIENGQASVDYEEYIYAEGRTVFSPTNDIGRGLLKGLKT